MSGRYNAFEVIKDLEHQLGYYTCAPYCAVVDSCTNAIGIVLEWLIQNDPDLTFKRSIEIPKLTYIGVAMQIKRVGLSLEFREEDWKGEYLLKGTPIWDSARRFRKEMWYENGPTKCYDVMGAKYKCLSFHRSKILGHSNGGAILHNNPGFQKYAEMMRFDGRTPGVPAQQDNPTVLGRHCYMNPETAAALLHNLMYTPDYNDDLPNDPYPDLSKMELFK